MLHAEAKAKEKSSLAVEHAGMLYGLLGVCSFSLTLPSTRLIVDVLSPASAGLGRSLVAALLAAVLLAIRRVPFPRWTEIKQLFLVAAGVVFGFPFFSAWAMERVPASHGAIIIALLPLATAGAAAFFSGERPSRLYWLSSITACLTILGYAISSGMGALQWADLALLAAVLSAAIGYAVGGKLSRTLGSWQVISWALVLAFPFLVVPIAGPLLEELRQATWSTWLGFGYVSVISQFLAFFAWYHGLAIGGVAKVGQIQYVQPFLTMLASWLLLAESITAGGIIAALIVVLAVAKGRSAVVKTSR